MGINVSTTKKTNYFYIIEGRLKTPASKDNPNAVNRTGTVGDKEYNKWELNIDSLDGMITNVFIKDQDFGRILNIIIEDGDEHMTLQTSLESNYASDFLRKAMNIDYTKKVELRSYSLETESGKTRSGFSIKQDGEKITNYYYNPVTKENVNGMPDPEKDGRHMDKDDWKMYFIKVRKFLTTMLDEELKQKIKEAQPLYVPDSDTEDAIHDTLAEEINKEAKELMNDNPKRYPDADNYEQDDLPF
ncbi:MAG: hypothetical protein JXR64_02580 [Spirochaetales bacterium]|nr:hypothetical protein [Spirochaetales bacterium]